MECKIQLEATLLKPEAVQEQADGETVQTQSPPSVEQTTTESPSDALNRSQFLREHMQFVRSIDANSVVKGIKM